ncbi:TPA_asm: hypothetical protein GZX72_14350 [Listeria monocytogenes]|nr:hypothetical protein [Listeria monocytogenes]
MFKRKKKNSKKEQLKQIKQKEKKSNEDKKLTKAEKKELKRKRKEFKKNLKKFDVEGGVGGDKMPSTKRDKIILYVFFFAIFLVMAGVVFLAVGGKAYSNHIKNNTSPYNTTLTFEKSDAKVQLKEVWTDKNREVTVVKLGYTDSAQDKLSNSGEFYDLYMQPNGKKPDAELKYGILGMEGDGYLFIKGKLNDQPYNIGITNTLNLTTKSIRDDNISEASSDALESSISSMNQDGSSNALFDPDKQSKKASSEFDYIKFIINPYSKSTKVFDGSFLTPSGNIDYSKVVAQTSVEKAIKSQKEKLKEHESNLKNLETSKKEYESRVKKEEKNSKKKDKKHKKHKKHTDDESNDDSDYQITSENASNLEKVEKSIEEEKETIEKIKTNIQSLSEGDFSKDDFGEMQNKSKIY